MFVRSCWKPTSRKETLDLVEQNPWALLVSNGSDGPLATNLPLLIEKAGSEEGDSMVLVGHIARANEHAQCLKTSGVPVLAIFEGPWSYVTASWYPNRDMPSTYYYTAVHCYGEIELQDEPALDHSLEVLTRQMESHYPNGWRTDEVPRSEITRRFAGIVGFRLHVRRMEAKFKLGQDEPIRDALAIAEALKVRGGFQDRELAELVRSQNQTRGA